MCTAYFITCLKTRGFSVEFSLLRNALRLGTPVASVWVSTKSEGTQEGAAMKGRCAMMTLIHGHRGHDTNRTNEVAIPDKINRGIDELHVFSRKGLWGMFLFLAASVLAFTFQDQSLTSILPPEFRECLGMTPPVLLIDMVLVVSTICSLILISVRIYDGREPDRNWWPHLGFRVSFYLLYFIADSLSGRIDIVFMTGIAVLALQHYHIWNYANKAIELKTSVWERLAAWHRGGNHSN